MFTVQEHWPPPNLHVQEQSERIVIAADDNHDICKLNRVRRAYRTASNSCDDSLPSFPSGRSRHGFPATSGDLTAAVL
jgi:hypothetical protein